MFCVVFFNHYCFIGTTSNTFLLQGIDKVLSIEQKETLGHTLHTLPQQWPLLNATYSQVHKYWDIDCRIFQTVDLATPNVLAISGPRFPITMDPIARTIILTMDLLMHR